jgi:hypothetical protein
MRQDLRARRAPACVIVKHANPCGVAIGADALEAYSKASRPTRPRPSAASSPSTARRRGAASRPWSRRKQFVEVLIAPGFTRRGAGHLRARPTCACCRSPLPAGGVARQGRNETCQARRRRPADADADNLRRARADLKVVTNEAADAAQIDDLLFAWKVAKFVKSNAIVFCGGGMTLGVGAGQMSRVDSARIAAIKAKNAGLSLAGSAVASDAFFPFRDGLDVVDRRRRQLRDPASSSRAASAMRDDEVIAAAERARHRRWRSPGADLGRAPHFRPTSRAFKAGLYHLAEAFPEVQLIPAWIDNVQRVMPKGEVVPVPILCTVTFGAPVALRPGEDKRAFLDRARAGGDRAARAPDGQPALAHASAQQVGLLFVRCSAARDPSSRWSRSSALLRERSDAQVAAQERSRDLRAVWVGACCSGSPGRPGRSSRRCCSGVVSFLALREFVTLTHTRRGDHRSLLLAFFVVLPLQYVLVGTRLFDLFTVFIPVYVFLAIPVISALANDPLRFLERTAKIQWGIAVCVYGMSHAPALLLLDLPELEGPRRLPGASTWWSWWRWRRSSRSWRAGACGAAGGARDQPVVLVARLGRGRRGGGGRRRPAVLDHAVQALARAG